MGLGYYNLWQNTLGYGGSAPKLAYLTDQQNCRMEQIRIARMIWRGWHRKAFLDESRTQFNYPYVKVQGIPRRLYVTFNVSKLVSTTLTDLLLGEEPLLKVDNEIDQQAMDDLGKRSDLHTRF